VATYAIGDVQGCFGELQALLAAIRFDRRNDRLWFVGDLVNRGPKSLAVLRFVKELGDAAVTVLGNHDLHLITFAAGLAKPRADDTLDEVLTAPDRDALVDWLRGLPMIHVEGEYVLVHAGLLPQWDVGKAQALGREVEAALRGPRHREFLASLYGGMPDRWDERLRGADRLRVIVNAMTRLRFCTPEGVMEFHSKGDATSAPPGYLPWFDVPGRKSASHTAVCGHWSALGLRMTPNLLALDSGCVWGGRLSAVRLEGRALTQVPCAAPAARESPARPR
jgi:bis(5'-nucleosyl)-tetraphosphatase (symmetrical)